MQTVRQYLFLVFITLTAFLCIIPILTYIIFVQDLSPREALVSSNDTGVKLFDIKDRPFFTFYDAKFRKEIPLSEIPKSIQLALIAREDKDFYAHPGFSIPAIIRSFYENIQNKSLSYGGSTITQQLVKNSLLNPRKDFLRKYQEVILAQEIERRYSKDQILEMYFNSVYFGEGAFGVEEAANIYFNKPARDLDLAQSAMLAAILPAPSRLSLFNGDLTEAKIRQKMVLERMEALGYISREQKENALREDVKAVPHETDINNIATHFALMVRDQLVKEYGEEWVAKSGLKVRTTLDLDWQKYAEEAVAKQVENLRGNHATNGAAVVLDPRTGEVRVLVGSKSWYAEGFGKVNVATSPRPPGSAFKPIVYVRAFEKGYITPATILKDEPTSFANFDENKFYASFSNRQAAQAALAADPNAFYKPLDYDRKFRGLVTVRRALANSLNIPSVAVMKKVGVDEALDSAKNLGITDLKEPSNYGLSLVLGTAEVKLLDLTNAYGVFANNGSYNRPTLILDISDKKGNVIYQFAPEPKQVLDPKYTFLISSILSDNKTRAEVFGTALNISRPAAVKTGTTENFKDAWTIGYTPNLVIGVWVGNNFGEAMDGIAGSLGAAPIWKSLMEKFSEGTPVEQFSQPDDIVKIPACGFSPAAVASGSASEYFVKGTAPIKGCFTPPSPATPSATPTPTPSPITYLIQFVF